eukprot:1179833-Prorocentrum_minimum.AAC.3
MALTQSVEFRCKPQNTRPRLKHCALGNKGLSSDLARLATRLSETHAPSRPPLDPLVRNACITCVVPLIALLPSLST